MNHVKDMKKGNVHIKKLVPPEKDMLKSNVIGFFF